MARNSRLRSRHEVESSHSSSRRVSRRTTTREDRDESDDDHGSKEPKPPEHLESKFINGLYRVNTHSEHLEDRIFSHARLLDPTTDEDEPNTEEVIPGAVSKLNVKAQADLTAKLVRYLIYLGVNNTPIRFGHIGKDVFPRYSGVTRYLLGQAKIQLKNIFGFELVAVPETICDGKFSKGSRETYFVLNAFHSANHLHSMNVYRNSKEREAQRGFLMTILGFMWCLPGRRVTEDELWKRLHHMDVDCRPKNITHPALGDLHVLMKTFESQLYLVSDQDITPEGKKVKTYSYGPRTYLEISKPRLLHFVHMMIHNSAPSEHLRQELQLENRRVIATD